MDEHDDHDPTDRAYWLAKTIAGFRATISPDNARRLAALMRGEELDYW